MVDNNIRLKRSERNVTQADVAKSLPTWFGAIVLSYIETGRTLPTKDGLTALCEYFECDPEDLYDPSDLDLLCSKEAYLPEDTDDHAEVGREGSKADRSPSKRQHGNMVEFRVWLRPSEKERIEEAIQALGYRNNSEWFREAYRSLIARETRLRIPIRPASVARAAE